MEPDYIKELAELADPNQLWRFSPLQQENLSEEQKRQIDMGVALRRYAAHIFELRKALDEKKSLLITPISKNGSAMKLIEIHAEHQKFFQKQVPNS